MDEQDSIFQGNVQLYLEGRNALYLINTRLEDYMDYFVFSPESKIWIRDFREDAITAARNASMGNDIYGFADVFNQPAWAKIYSHSDEVKVELYPCYEQGEFPILWFGVFEDNMMPVTPVEWEFLVSLRNDQTAFLSLINSQSVVGQDYLQDPTFTYR